MAMVVCPRHPLPQTIQHGLETVQLQQEAGQSLHCLTLKPRTHAPAKLRVCVIPRNYHRDQK